MDNLYLCGEGMVFEADNLGEEGFGIALTDVRLDEEVATILDREEAQQLAEVLLRYLQNG